jgi:aminopeptidase N
MENASAIFYAEQSVTGDRKWEDVLAHEIAHQWFGDMASEKSFAHLWLSEGFATYLTNIYLENKYGRQEENKRLQQERKEIIEFTKENHHPVVDSTTDLMSLLNANSYQKGSWVLHMLRAQMGDTVFQKILQAYYQQYKGSNAETRDFERVAEKVSATDLKWFFDQWLYQPDIPRLRVKWKKTGSHSLSITVEQTGKSLYRFPLAMSLASMDGKRQVKSFSISKSSETFVWDVDYKPGSLIVDPNTDLLFDGTSGEGK